MAAPPKKKQKIIPSHWYLDLTRELQKHHTDAEHIKLSFNQLLLLTENLHPAAISVIKSIQQALSLIEEAQVSKHIQARMLSLEDAKKYVGINFEPGDPDYRWSLKDHQKQPTKLSEWTESAIQNIRRSKYLRTFGPESLVRTLFDILVCDRLELLDDTAAAKQLKVVAEVQMDVLAEYRSIHTRISGRADWTLGYMDEKDNLQEMLVVIEAKARGNIVAALPQLLIYLAGIQDARSMAKKTNKTVFGVATDSDQFIFAILKENRNAFVSKALDWLEEKELIVSFLDNILQDAIESSPHTTRVRIGNKKIKQFEQALGKTYMFGDQGCSSSSISDDDSNNLGTWNVVEVNGVSLLQLCEEDEDNAR